MAVEIPVYVNITKGFDAAASQIPKEMPKLERAISKNVLNIPVTLGHGYDNIKDVLTSTTISAKDLKSVLKDLNYEFNRQSKLEEKSGKTSAQVKNLAKAYGLVEQRLTGVYNGASSAGMMVVNTINKVKAKLEELRNQRASLSTDPSSKAFRDINYQIKVQEDRLRKLNLQYEQYRVAALRSSNTVATSMNKANNSLSRHNRLLQSVPSLAASYVSIWQAFNFIRNIRETTAEFEMQRVALAGIIQDTEQANSLFRQIKAAALQSPFQIKDLVKDVKQLSAYRIETDKLFDVTTRLADVSAGLGVDMNRLILAYGQVRAASVLRGQELRQFTEAGVPLVEELAKKFTELNGRMTSTAEVFELISKRAVPFSMIEEIFNDMTEAGGVFYKMQEKQAETLAGQWANLKDALSIMYDEIGNSPSVHNAMEDLISSAKVLFNNWRQIATIIGVVGQGYVALKIASLFMPKLAYNTELAEKATLAFARASALEAKQQERANIVRAITIRSLKNYAIVTKHAAAAQTSFGRGFLRLGAFLAGGGWISIAITAATVLTGWLISAHKEANRLKNELAKIGVEGDLSLNRSVSNFNRLADAAVNAADGSEEQNKAIAELKRTYGDIIPVEELQVNKLRTLQGSYQSLTKAIEEKINMQIKEQKINEIQDSFSTKITKANKSAQRILMQYGLDKDQIRAILHEVQATVDEGLLDINSSVETRASIFQNIIKKTTGIIVDFNHGFTDYNGAWHSVYDETGRALKSLTKIVSLYSNLHSETEQVESDMDSLIGSMGRYAKSWKNLEDALKDVTLDEMVFGKPNTFAYKEEVLRERIRRMSSAIENAFKDTGIDISQAFKVPGRIDFKFLSEASKQAAASGNWGIDSFVAKIQKKYEGLIPSDEFTNVLKVKFADIAKSVGVSMDDVQGYLKKGDEDVRKYTKGIQEAHQEAKDKFVEMQKQNELAQDYSVVMPVSDEDLDKQGKIVAFFEALLKYLDEFVKHNKGPRDTRLSQLKSDISELTNAYKKFKELTKYKGEQSALSDINKLFPQLEGWTPTKDNLVKRLNEMLDKVKSDLARSPKSKTLLDMKRALETEISNLEFDDLKDTLEKKLKNLQDEVKRSETARNFFNNILDLTGDEKLSASLTMEVYGQTGKEFKERVQDEMLGALESAKDLMGKDFFDKMTEDIKIFNVKEIRSQLQLLPETIRPVFERLLNEQEKFEADWYQNYYKVYAKSKDYSDRLADNEKKRAQALKEARERGQDTAAVNAFYDKKAAEIQLEAMKDTYTWTKAFENLEGVSTYTLKNLIALIDEYIEKNAKDLEPQQLRELMRSRERAEAQLIERNAFEQLEDAISDYVKARKKKAKLDKDSKEDAEASAQAADDEADALDRASRAMDKAVGYINELASATKELLSAFASDKDASYYSEQIDNLTKSLAGAAQTAQGVMRLITSAGADPAAYVQTFTGVASFITGIVNAINAARIKKANDEIERQARALSDLEYAYGRLDKAIDDAFGNARIYNYNQQIEILKRKLDALNTQLDAERSKGNKASQDAINGYLDSIRETEAALADLQRLPAEFWAGQELTSASESFVDSWLSAKKEFGDTTAAIEETMQQMVENLISKAAMSGVVQAVLKPWYDELNKIEAWDSSTIARMVQSAYSKIPMINDGLEVAYSSLAAAGLDVRRIVGNLTGISRNYATASEESILGLTAATNTQNYYMSYMPTINDHVAAIRARLVGDGGGDTAAAPEGPTYQDQMLIYASNLPLMRSDTEAIRSMLERVIKPAGTTATHYVSVRM